MAVCMSPADAGSAWLCETVLKARMRTGIPCRYPVPQDVLAITLSHQGYSGVPAARVQARARPMRWRFFSSEPRDTVVQVIKAGGDPVSGDPSDVEAVFPAAHRGQQPLDVIR